MRHLDEWRRRLRTVRFSWFGHVMIHANDIDRARIALQLQVDLNHCSQNYGAIIFLHHENMQIRRSDNLVRIWHTKSLISVQYYNTDSVYLIVGLRIKWYVIFSSRCRNHLKFNVMIRMEIASLLNISNWFEKCHGCVLRRFWRDSRLNRTAWIRTIFSL